MHTLLWIAIALAVLWIVLRFAVALTGAALHVIWIVALVMLVFWIIGLLRGGGGTPPTV